MNRLPAEWEPHEALLLALPHEHTDWEPYLEEILEAYEGFLRAITRFEPVIVLCNDTKKAKKRLGHLPNLHLVQARFNDTWIRDFGPIDVEESGLMRAYDFTFNAWGDKFGSSLDNAITEFLHTQRVLTGTCKKIDLILEGGSIESNGEGVLLTTTTCLLNPNRNWALSKETLGEKLSQLFGLEKILWLDHGHLEGDDTDAHIDTLARFITPDTIAYVTCKDPNDSHFGPLKKMEEELKRTHFSLLPLPLPKPIIYDDHRLPATYANFIFVNGGLIVPTYNQPSDAIALNTLQNALPHLEVVGVDARVFIRQHGSLHCACMQRFAR
ncbi:MAG: agmatine deiminase family protein [Campylobacterales bacterium]|nr:agmatine deiminase family protein [Campylobacterales bacterium]